MSTALAYTSEKRISRRNKIDVLEDALRKEIDDGAMELTIVDCAEDNSQADHYFGDGVYARGLWIPEGTVLVGKLHKLARVCVIASGTCSFYTELRKKTVSAPWVGEFEKGSKTVVVAHTDTYWVACLGTDLKDPDEIVDQLVTSTHEKYEEYLNELEEEK